VAKKTAAKKSLPKRKPGYGRPPKKTTKAQMVSRRHYVARLLLVGFSRDDVLEKLRDREPDLTDQQLAYAYDSVMTVWEGMAEETARTARVQAQHRLRNDLATLRDPILEGRKDAAKQIDWAAVGRHERLLSQIEGTMRPIVVVAAPNAQRQALHALIDDLGDEQLDQIVEEELGPTG
jgi:hypothetical protein